MSRKLSATDDLSASQLRQLVEMRYDEAAAIADEKARRAALSAAERLQFEAKIKGWINSDLMPPE
jgi:hypothetical protein